VYQTEVQNRSIFWLLVPSRPRPALQEASDFLFLINRWSQNFACGWVFFKAQNQTMTGSVHPDVISFCFPELSQITLLQPQKVSRGIFKDGERQICMQMQTSVLCRMNSKWQNYVLQLLNPSWKDMTPFLISLYQGQW